MTVTLKDPCDPPVSLTPIVLENQRYTITGELKSYTHADVIADPAYCPVRYEYTIQPLANDGTPITESSDVDKTFDIYYDADLTPLDQTLTVTVKAVSYSVYGTFE